MHYNFDALNHSPNHPARALTDTFYVRPLDGGEASGDLLGGYASDVVLRTHTSPMQVARWRPTRPRCMWSSPGGCTGPTATPPTRPSSIRSRAWPSTRTSRWPISRHPARVARSVFGDEREVRLRPHFFPFTEPSVEVDVPCFHCPAAASCATDRAARCARARAGWKSSGPARWIPTSTATYDTIPAEDHPEKVQGFAWGMGVERIAMSQHGVPGWTGVWTHQDHLCSWSSSDDIVPRNWLCASTETRRSTSKAVEERLTMTGTKVEAIHHHGVQRPIEHFRAGCVL